MSEKFEILRPFGPPIAKFKIPLRLVKKINNFVDEIIKDKNKSLSLDVGSKLSGQVSQEIALPKEIMEDEILELFSRFTISYVRETLNQKIKNFNLLQCWVVRQFKNEYNPTHWHGGHISGAGFLKVPKDLGKHVQDKQNKEYRGGNLQLIHGSRMFLSSSTINIKPKVGDFYFFPNYLMHTVFPFRSSEEERRSISFNALIDENIYNVYGKA